MAPRAPTAPAARDKARPTRPGIRALVPATASTMAAVPPETPRADLCTAASAAPSCARPMKTKRPEPAAFSLDSGDEQGKDLAVPTAPARGSSLARGYQTLGASFYSMASDTEEVTPRVARPKGSRGSVTHREQKCESREFRTTSLGPRLAAAADFASPRPTSSSRGPRPIAQNSRDLVLFDSVPQTGALSSWLSGAPLSARGAPSALEMDLGIAPVAAATDLRPLGSSKVVKAPTGFLPSLDAGHGKSANYTAATVRMRSVGTPRGMRNAGF